VSDENLTKCQEIIDYHFRDVELLRRALTHASAATSRDVSNERLEFLGDAVLGLVVCEEIFSRAPDLPEGEMTEIKSAVVSRRTCARLASQMGLTDLLIVGKGLGHSMVLPSSLPAAAFEAVIGAIFMDGGLEAARKFILRHTEKVMQAAMASRHQRNYKSMLQQYAQRTWNSMPEYELLDEKGPEHAKCFEVSVRINGRQFGSAWGPSKKEAEQKAALQALVELGLLEEAEAEPAEPTQTD